MSGRVEIITGPERRRRWSDEGSCSSSRKHVVPAIRCRRLPASAASARANCSGGVARRWQKVSFPTIDLRRALPRH